MPPARALLIAILIPVAVAVAWLLPFAARAEFLADDFVLTNLLDAGGESASWTEIGHQFGSRWLYSQAYWRPIVNVVHGVNIDLLGFTPLALVTVNLMLHAGVVAGTALLCLRLPGQRSPVLGAVLGTMFCAFHPATVETVLWISARVTGLEVFFRIGALCVFQAHLLRPSRARYATTAVLSALALGSKESAVMLPAALLLLDVLHDPRRPWRARAALHAPLVALWTAYVVVRIAVLGSFVGSPLPEPSFIQLAEILAPKIALLGLPIAAAYVLWWVAFMGSGLIAGRDRLGRHAVGIAVLLVWLVACFAPTYKTPLGHGFVGSRMLYDALPVVALLIAHGVGAAATGRARLGMGALAVALVGATLAPGLDYARQFQNAWVQTTSARRAIARAAVEADARRPIGILSMPRCPDVPGPMNPISYFLLGERPFVEPPFPAVGLGYVLDRFPYSAPLFEDPRPVRALLGAGSRVAVWNEALGELVVWERDSDGGPAPDRAAGPELLFDEPVSPFAVELIEVVTDADVHRGSVVWRTSRGDFGGPVGLDFDGGDDGGSGARTFTIDATRHAPLLVLALANGTLHGVRVIAPGVVRQIGVRGRLPRIELPRRLDGAAIDYDALPHALIAPAGTPDRPMRLVLAGAATGFAVPVEAGAPIELPEDVLFHVRMFANAIRADRFHYWFETETPQGAPGSARSAVDHFVVRDVPR